MSNRNRFISLGLAAVIGLGVLAIPSQASAQISRNRRNEKQHRTNAYGLAAAGAILMSQKQETLGTIALAGAAYEAKRLQDEINARHNRYGDERGYYDRDGRWRTGSSNRTDGYYDSAGRWHSYSSSSNRNYGYYDRNGNWHTNSASSNRNGYYDRNGNWHSDTSTNRDGYYDSNGRWHSYNSSNDRYNRRDDDCDDDRRDNRSGRYDRNDRNNRNGRNGREWSSTRGNKNGWDKNGKRRSN